MFLSDDAYPFVARTLDLEPISTISTERPAVGLVIRAPAALDRDLVTALRRRQAHASFAPSPASLKRSTISASGPPGSDNS